MMRWIGIHLQIVLGRALDRFVARVLVDEHSRGKRLGLIERSGILERLVLEHVRVKRL